jgi:hypothetical protein
MKNLRQNPPHVWRILLYQMRLLCGKMHENTLADYQMQSSKSNSRIRNRYQLMFPYVKLDQKLFKTGTANSEIDVLFAMEQNG